MVKNPLITVIVPIYGVEEYLPSCIESIQRQTYQNLQILLVEDGSPDRCGEICDGYAQEDGRIQVIHQVNGGVSAARNAGLTAAKGEYVCFVDGDDRIKPQMIQRALEELEAGPYDLCAWGAEVWENGVSRLSGRRRERCFSLQTQRERERFFCRWFFTARTGWEVYRRIFRRKLIERFGLRFGKAAFAEDMDFTFRYLLHCRNFRLIPDPLYMYQIRSSSAMQTIVRQSQVEQFLYLLQKQRKDLADWGPLPIYEAVALSIFIGEPQRGEPPQKRARQLRDCLQLCPQWKALQQDAQLVLADRAAVRKVCGLPYSQLALAFCQFLLDGDEELYQKHARVYYGYLGLKAVKDWLTGHRGGKAG